MNSVPQDEEFWWPYYRVDKNSGRHDFITNRGAVACIAIISLISCFIDKVILHDDFNFCRNPITAHILSLRCWLISCFQMANILLLMATIVENTMLLEIYICFTLAFVLLGLGVSLAQFLIRVKLDGLKKAAKEAGPEVAFLFVLFRCLPIVNRYGRELKGG